MQTISAVASFPQSRPAGLPVSPNRPVLVAKSARDPGKNVDSTIANDMEFGDYTAEQIRRIRWNFALDDFTAGLNTVSATRLFSAFRMMATTLFSVGTLRSNIERMIDKFQRNEGGIYVDSALNQAASNHPRAIAL